VLIESVFVLELTHANLWASAALLTTEQVLILVILTIIDVSFLIATIVWHKLQKRK
jgi:hypothetical protein